MSICVCLWCRCVSAQEIRGQPWMLVLSSYFRHSLAHRHMCQATWSAGFEAFCFLCLPSDFSVEIRHSCHGQLWGAELSTFRLGGKHLSHETFHFRAITIGGVCQCSRFRNEAEKILQLNKMKVIEIVPPKSPKFLGLLSATSCPS